MTDLFLGIDPGVYCGSVLLDIKGMVLTYNLAEFGPKLGIKRYARIAEHVRDLIYDIALARHGAYGYSQNAGRRLWIAIETEVSTRPYSRRKTRGAQMGVLQTLATHNRIVGAVLVAAVLAQQDVQDIDVIAPTASGTSKKLRSLAAQHGGFVPADIAPSSRHHLYDAWYLADTLRRSRERSRK